MGTNKSGQYPGRHTTLCPLFGVGGPFLDLDVPSRRVVHWKSGLV